MSACQRCGKEHPKCTGHNAAGNPCGKAPIKGANVCRTHGGAAPQVKAAAQRRMDELAARREVSGIVRRLGLEVEVDEGEALLRELYRCHASVLYLSRVVASMGDSTADAVAEALDNPRASADGLIWRSRGPMGTVLQLHPLVKLWQDERAQLARVAAAIQKLGLAERQTKLAEAQGAALLEVVYGVLRDLGVDPEGDKAQGVVLRHLQAVAG